MNFSDEELQFHFYPPLPLIHWQLLCFIMLISSAFISLIFFIVTKISSSNTAFCGIFEKCSQSKNVIQFKDDSTCNSSGCCVSTTGAKTSRENLSDNGRVFDHEINDNTICKVLHHADGKRSLNGYRENMFVDEQRECSERCFLAMKNALTKDDVKLGKNTPSQLVLRTLRRIFRLWNGKRISGDRAVGVKTGLMDLFRCGLLIGDDDINYCEDNESEMDRIAERLRDRALHDGVHTSSTEERTANDYVKQVLGYGHNFPIFRGVPKQPLYRELVRRLDLIREVECNAITSDEQPGYERVEARILLKSQEKMHTQSEASRSLSSRPTQTPYKHCRHRYVMDASYYGMQEIHPFPIVPRPPPIPPTTDDYQEWAFQAGHRAIREVLGLRHSVGTRILSLPPSWRQLIDTSSKAHPKCTKSPKLSVAARARAKHVHRAFSKQSYFGGGIKGGPEEQNVEAAGIVHRLLRNATWMNCHTFGGGTTVFEVRVNTGYGARWEVSWSNQSDCSSVDVSVGPPDIVIFRGFLEPPMDDGHEKRWTH